MAENKKLAQEESDKFLNMLKKTLEEQINFPGKGQFVEFDIVG